MDPWNQDLSVGVAEADEVHRALYELSAQAKEAMDRGDRAAVQAHLDDLRTASADHFAAEERLMETSGFAGLKDHRAAHAAYLGELDKLGAELAARGLSPLFRLWFGSRLTDWLRFHLRGADAQFYRHWRLHQEEQARAAEARLAAEAAGRGPAGGAPSAGSPRGGAKP
jgi:hemerythrin-like metal-binding protein